MWSFKKEIYNSLSEFRTAFTVPDLIHGAKASFREVPNARAEPGSPSGDGWG